MTVLDHYRISNRRVNSWQSTQGQERSKDWRDISLIAGSTIIAAVSRIQSATKLKRGRARVRYGIKTTGRDSPRRGTRAHPKYLSKWSERDGALTVLAGRITSTRWCETYRDLIGAQKRGTRKESIIGEGFSIRETYSSARSQNIDEEIQSNRQHSHRNYYLIRCERNISDTHFCYVNFSFQIREQRIFDI